MAAALAKRPEVFIYSNNNDDVSANSIAVAAVAVVVVVFSACTTHWSTVE